jgi:hypothetical protein
MFLDHVCLRTSRRPDPIAGWPTLAPQPPCNASQQEQALYRIVPQSFWSKSKIATDTDDCDVGRRPVASRNPESGDLAPSLTGAARNASPSWAVGFPFSRHEEAPDAIPTGARSSGSAEAPDGHCKVPGLLSMGEDPPTTRNNVPARKMSRPHYLTVKSPPGLRRLSENGIPEGQCN